MFSPTLLWGAGARSPRKSIDELRVLFIGNSLTYENDLPALIEALAGHKRFKFKMIALPDYGLVDHWNNGDARKEIAKRRWDVVVLQQGPSASLEGREYLIRYAKLFAEDIRRAGAKPALYMVWPSETRFGDFDRVSESYALAAKEVGGILLPVGEAWRAAWRRNRALGLYSSDKFHPSTIGSYLAALVIVMKLFELPPDQLPSNRILHSWNGQALSVEQIDLLLTAAAEATNTAR